LMLLDEKTGMVCLDPVIDARLEPKVSNLICWTD